MTTPRLRIKKRDQQRLRDGHLWVYSNEVDTDVTPLKNIKTALVHLEDYRGQFLATASFNNQALICARILDTEPRDVLDAAFFEKRIQTALELRQIAFKQDFYRLVYGEGDLLSGLVIDRFAQTFVVQIGTQAIEQAKDALVAALQKIFGATAIIVFKNDGKGRSMEQLDEYVETVPADANVTELEVIENGVSFKAPLDGQKTGWFYDHRDGRKWLNDCAQGRTVLDVFSYIGGWGIQAAAHGATEVTCVDSSAKAGESVLANAALNKLSQVTFVESDAFEYFKKAASTTYDLVVLDPPALIQKRRDFEQGRQAYFLLNEGAIQRVKDGGLLVSASCSLHLDRDELIRIVQQVARRQNKHVQMVHEAHPAADHPRLIPMTESDYLKCLVFRVTALPEIAAKH
ncbi:MAG: class I SAM-dependent rRNA methyltransferase [Candidatus Saccharibacteria bacterium]|nr:class I SAM-dependent rRNA methyltransferase [Moraxellaceae bacterium]